MILNFLSVRNGDLMMTETRRNKDIENAVANYLKLSDFPEFMNIFEGLADLADQKTTPIDTLKGAMDNEKPTEKD